MAGNDPPATTDDPGAVAASASEHAGDATSDPPVLAVDEPPSHRLPLPAVRR